MKLTELIAPIVPDHAEREALLDWMAWIHQRPAEAPPVGLCLIGPPGSGKTLLVNLLAVTLPQDAVVAVAGRNPRPGELTDAQVAVFEVPMLDCAKSYNVATTYMCLKRGEPDVEIARRFGVIYMTDGTYVEEAPRWRIIRTQLATLACYDELANAAWQRKREVREFFRARKLP